MILDKCVPVRHTLPSLPPEFKQMRETPADLTTDEERDSSSEESDDNSGVIMTLTRVCNELQAFIFQTFPENRR